MAKRSIAGFVIQDDSMLVANNASLASNAARHQIAEIGNILYPEAGGLMGFSDDRSLMYRRAATFVDKIFKGIKPGDLPIELPTRFEMVVNMKTAKTLGMKIPQSILLQATRLID